MRIHLLVEAINLGGRQLPPEVIEIINRLRSEGYGVSLSDWYSEEEQRIDGRFEDDEDALIHPVQEISLFPSVGHMEAYENERCDDEEWPGDDGGEEAESVGDMLVGLGYNVESDHGNFDFFKDYEYLGGITVTFNWIGNPYR